MEYNMWHNIFKFFSLKFHFLSNQTRIQNLGAQTHFYNFITRREKVEREKSTPFPPTPQPFIFSVDSPQNSSICIITPPFKNPIFPFFFSNLSSSPRSHLSPFFFSKSRVSYLFLSLDFWIPTTLILLLICICVLSFISISHGGDRWIGAALRLDAPSGGVAGWWGCGRVGVVFEEAVDVSECCCSWQCGEWDLRWFWIRDVGLVGSFWIWRFCFWVLDLAVRDRGWEFGCAWFGGNGWWVCRFGLGTFEIVGVWIGGKMLGIGIEFADSVLWEYAFGVLTDSLLFRFS